MTKKYKLTKTKKEWFGITFYQIEALKDFNDVKKGERGGWIEKESNLSQEGNAWVYGNARVSGDAFVYGNAQVSGNARV
ncbi:MAG: polymer-forming cytoskeletal protein, partial [Candidatus Pacearchaeota archaeon]